MRNFVITVNGKSYQVGVEEVGGAATPVAPVANVAPVAPAPAPVVAAAPVATPAVSATPAPVPTAQAPADGEKLLSPFPGLIKNLLVEEGATVKKDQPVLVLEAMKMDNDITAPCDGVVHFCVTKGSNVESDAVLAVIG